MSNFDKLVASSCGAATSSERNDVTKSWTFCILVPESEEGKDSRFGGVWGFRIMGGEFGVGFSVATS